MTNLYSEVMRACKEDDIRYVFIGENRIDKDWFLEEAKNITYDSGLGSQVINSNLKILLKNDSWLERCEYDGSEWFTLKAKPIVKGSRMMKNNLEVIFEKGQYEQVDEFID